MPHGLTARGLRAASLLGALIVMPLWAGVAATPSAGTAPHGRQDERTTWDSVFSAAQAGRGETTYKQLCARCHMETLAGGDEAGEPAHKIWGFCCNFCTACDILSGG